MRTRTKRWILILASAAIPIASLIEFADFAARRPASPSMPMLTDACGGALDVGRFSLPLATTRLQGLLTDKSASQADRLCAAAELHRIHPPGLADLILDLSNGLLGWLGRRG